MLIRFLNKFKRQFATAVFFAAITYTLIVSPSLINLHTTSQAQNLNITNIVMQYVNRYYVNKSLIEPKNMLVKALDRLEVIADEVLVDFPQGEEGSIVEVQVVNDKQTFDISSINDLNDVSNKLEEIFTFVAPKLNSRDYEVSDIEYAVIDEMLKTLDTHSGIITPEVYKEFMIETEGSFGGLGIVIGIRDGELTVISPIEGTPAYNIGIKPNDKIVQIEDESTINMSLLEAVSKLRGDKGTQVAIHINRDSFAQPKEYKIIRDTIKIESVETFDLDDGIKYVRIRDFQKNTLNSIVANLKEDEKPAKGIILDLRGNPGGLLDQAERISNMFLSQGVIVTTKEGNSANHYHANDKDYEYLNNVVVLVDAGSASASEIVAGALKNNDRAVVIGERTFGKGSVQQIFDLPDGSALKLTRAKYFTPGDISIQDVGVTPDIILHPTTIKEDTIIFNSNLEPRLNKLNGDAAEKVQEKREEPLYTITYLEDIKVEEEGEEPTPEEALTKQEKRERLENDFYVSLAKDIILSSETPTRQQALNQIQKDISKITKEEDKKIVDQWQTLGVDWDYGKSPSSKPALNINILPQTPMAKAGEEAKLTVEVENKGTEPLYRLSAITESENLVLNGKELIFGKVGPGESRSWSTDIEIPKWALTREDKVTLKFKDGHETTIDDYDFNLNIAGLDRPLYAFNYEIVDDGRFGSSGNGNGTPEPGETIALVLRVKNIGLGSSEKTVVSLKNESGDTVFLEKGRAELENLKPEEIRQTEFTFNVQNNESPIEFEIQILDEVFRDGIVSNVSIPNSSETQAYKKVNEEVKVSKDNTPIRGGGFSSAPIIALSEQGATFNSSGRSNGWIKINLDEQMSGWISKDKVQTASSSENGQPVNPVFVETFEAPPIINLIDLPVSTKSNVINLFGDIKDQDGIELVSVFIGDDKVALLPSTKTDVPVSVDLKLEEDINLITIIAKDSKGLLSKQSFVVRKEG
ncbi:MAG: MXAN_5808 family serine peptidase [Thermodesulfobacteriota bacterium]